MHFKELSTEIGSEVSGTSEGYRSSHYTQFSNVYSDDSIIPPSAPPTEITRLPVRTARIFQPQPTSNMQPLTSADAVILGNMFLQKMRRPDWATDSQVTDQDNGEQSVFGNKLKKQLLKEPLPRSSHRWCHKSKSRDTQTPITIYRCIQIIISQLNPPQTTMQSFFNKC